MNRHTTALLADRAIHDARAELPRRPTKRWSTRDPAAIQGVAVTVVSAT